MHSLNTHEKSIARALFRIRVYESDGNAYEKLFTEIMRFRYSDFEPVKPHGPLGDGGNDGFHKDEGIYYQVYAPEDLSINHKNAIKKLEGDFAKLFKNWNHQVSAIRKYYFVTNDKFKGAFQVAHESIEKIKSTHSLEKADTFLTQHLEKVFFELEMDEIISLIGIIPEVDHINEIYFSELNEVISHLCNVEFDPALPKFPLEPDFFKKIEFNGLSEHCANLLNKATYQLHSLKAYFSKQEPELVQNVRNELNRFYTASKERYDSDENSGDMIFYDILNKASPARTKPITDAALVVMSYFFETCDIFEEPINANSN